jgi:hypothetical protein
MTSIQAFLVIIVSATVAHTQPLRAEPLSFPGGSYEVTARLELPHLERWGVDKTTIICLPDSRGAGEIPVPVVRRIIHSPNAPRRISLLTVRGSNMKLFAVNEAPQEAMRFTSFRATHLLVASRW